MSYSSAALRSAMSKSVFFKDVFTRDENKTCLQIAKLEITGYYKVILSSNYTTAIFEIAQNKIISMQSISSKHPIPTNSENIIDGLDEFYAIIDSDGILKIQDFLSDTNDTTLSINIEYSGADFEIAVQTAQEISKNNNTHKFYFNTSEFELGIITRSVSADYIDVGMLEVNIAKINKIKLGDWLLTSDSTNGNVKLTLDTNSSEVS